MLDIASLCNVEALSHVVCFIMLCAACSPSPFAIPLAAFFVWGVSDEMYNTILNALGGHWGLIAFGVTGAAIITYWINGLLLLFVDVIYRPKVVHQFKIQADPKMDFDLRLIGKVVKNILIGQFCVILPCGLMYAYLSERGIGMYRDDKLPTKREQAVHMIGYVLVDEFLFYYGHLFLHQTDLFARIRPLAPRLFGAKINMYNSVHKIHHEFKAPIGLVASYCHPLEMFLSNVLPLTSGMVLLRSHVFSGLTWAVFAVLGTQTHHCGYRWPWVPSFDHQPDFHDFHHQKFNTNYGLTGWCDALHGTDKQWKAYLEKRRCDEEKKGVKRSSGNNTMYLFFLTILIILTGTSLAPGTVQAGVV